MNQINQGIEQLNIELSSLRAKLEADFTNLKEKLVSNADELFTDRDTDEICTLCTAKGNDNTIENYVNDFKNYIANMINDVIKQSNGRVAIRNRKNESARRQTYADISNVVNIVDAKHNVKNHRNIKRAALQNTEITSFCNSQKQARKHGMIHKMRRHSGLVLRRGIY